MRSAAGALLLLCAACTSGGAEDDGAVPPPEGTAGTAATRHVLRVATASDVSVGPVRERLIEAWDKSRDDYTVEIVKLPVAADGVRSQLVAALQSGSADYDVVNIDVAWTAEFAAGGLIRPLAGGLPDDMWPRVAETARYDGKTWAVPFNTDAGLLYYRTDVWKDRNWRPPSTWGALELDVINATTPDRARKRFGHGYITQLGPYEGLTVNAQEAVWARGGELVNGAGEVTAASAEVQNGLADLYRQYEQIMPKGLARTADEHDSMVAFRDGKVPFMRNWPYVYNLLDAPGSKVQGRFGVAPLPGRGDGKAGVSVLGGQNLAITANSEQSPAARELLDYLTRPEQQRCLLEYGFAPVLKSSYDPSSTAACALPREPGGGGGEEQGAGPERWKDGLPPYAAPLRRALETARPRPVTPYYAAFTELVQTEVHGLLTDGTDQETVATELSRRLRPVMKGG
ncbi:extracellular solute-binding protein [Streptomyces sp. XD-27]|uniref:extracellular solute-binding protein n=1 Tax=Streptomyces sp. XD-27 TaxID=3062779 RepID=UPI0026F443C5|nr:extracellular solute-binding protein [Streptomyces sp. XD-27]WKX72129.1 extracellular solute-binding protein [Streptomyces sp. XD-27]